MVGYSEANTKIKQLSQVAGLRKYLTYARKVYSFDLISGWSCPFAKDCLSKVHRINGRSKIVDGPDTQFRCFSASQEALLPNVYNKRMENFLTVKKLDSPFTIADCLDSLLPEDAGIVRIHVGGDMFNRNYFLAWLWIAVRNPSVLFYAYTKSLNFWIDNLDLIPDNMVLTASRGGRLDHLIDKHSLREAIVVGYKTEAERLAAIAAGAKGVLPSAEKLGLEIDHDDSHAADLTKKNESFALLIHGVQPAGSEAATALKALKGKGSYARKV